LDALEALHPGEIERLLAAEIERYYDTTLDERLAETTAQAEADLGNITEEAHARHADRLLFAKWSRDATAARINQLREQIAEEERRLEERVQPLFDTITSELDAESPMADDYDWPEPEDGDEDPDPLFDSTRSYDEQMERYREHQGKPEDTGRKTTLLNCVICGGQFEALRSDAQTCSKACREKRSRQPRDPHNENRRFADEVISRMQDGETLHLVYSEAASSWMLSSGAKVPTIVALIVTNDTRVVGIGDTLVEGRHDRAWRHV
jgi:hypothetical protein